MISRSKKFVFVHIPKTAGNSIALALQQYSDDQIVFTNRQQEYNESVGGLNRFGLARAHLDLGKHARLEQILSAWETDALGDPKDYFKFACVRNPWDRLVSFYFSPHARRKRFNKTEFESFIGKTALRGSQSAFVLVDGHCAVDFLVRFEHLEDDLAIVAERLGIEISLPHVNRSKHRPFQDYYDGTTRAMVQSLFREEIELFDYRFQPA
jgi:sulfotransferase famil protein